MIRVDVNTEMRLAIIVVPVTYAERSELLRIPRCLIGTSTKTTTMRKAAVIILNDNGNVNWHMTILRSLLGDESVGLVADGSLPSIERTSSTDQGLKLARDMLCSRSTI